MGIIVQGKELWRALYPRTRRRVLGLFFGHPHRSFYANEVVRLANVGTGSVQRELRRLSDAGLLIQSRIGNQVHYQANESSPFFPEIRSMVVKAFGAFDLLRKAVQSLEPEPVLALLHGAGVAVPDREQAIEMLLVVRDIDRQQAEKPLMAAAQSLGRSLNLTLLRPERFERLLEEKNEALLDLLEQPRVVLFGELRGF